MWQLGAWCAYTDNLRQTETIMKTTNQIQSDQKKINEWLKKNKPKVCPTSFAKGYDGQAKKKIRFGNRVLVFSF